jgi:hypothetical protein
MAEEFEGRDLSDAVFWGVDLKGARFRDVDMTDVTISHARIVNVDIDGLVDHVTINGVDVTHYVNERDSWYPLRAMIRPADIAGMHAAWSALEQTWAGTIERAQRLTEAQVHVSVGGEWSFVETVRHLVFAMDKWFTVPILDQGFHPIGLPNTGSADFGWPGLDRSADPTLSEALDVRTERSAKLHDYLDNLRPEDLVRTVDVLENGPNPVNECLYTVFEEEFEHNRYATRDLAHLEPAAR